MDDFLKDRKMRTVIREKKFALRSVLSGVPQGSVLAPGIFAVHINDMPERMYSHINLFVDDVKLLRKVQKKDCLALQQDFGKIFE